MSNPLQEGIQYALREALLALHTLYISRVEKLYRSSDSPPSAPPDLVDIKPLNMYQRKGNAPAEYPIIQGVPILNGVQFYVKKFDAETGTLIHDIIKPGALVLCACCERDISSSLTGQVGLPSKQWHHSMTDSVVIGIVSHGDYYTRQNGPITVRELDSLRLSAYNFDSKQITAKVFDEDASTYL